MSRGFPSMTALLGLLAVAGYQNRDKIAEMFGKMGAGAPTGGPRQGSTPGGLEGVLGNLGGLLGGASAGSMLNGGLSELVERFQKNGYGDAAQSWVSNEQNRDIQPPELKQAIGPDVLETLSEQTGLSQQEILARLTRELPEAVNRYTPNGRLPTGEAA